VSSWQLSTGLSRRRALAARVQRRIEESARLDARAGPWRVAPACLVRRVAPAASTLSAMAPARPRIEPAPRPADALQKQNGEPLM
jgi:hypothetical protein